MPETPLTLGERLDRLPWSRWHLRLVVALGVAWLLDGLEGSLAGSLAGALKAATGLGFSDADLGLSSTIYLAGGVIGALVFGFLADRFGRKRLFMVTLLIYLIATTLTATSWNLFTFTLCRFFTGAGIGGEYAAINSAVDELIPARVRGQVNLAINGTFWLGIVIGSIISSLLLSSPLAAGWSWRAAFVLGLPVGLLVLNLRRHIPESPRWLKAHGRGEEANAIVTAMESEAPQSAFAMEEILPVVVEEPTLETASDTHAALWRALLRSPRRALVCLALMTAQAFCYNSVFFSLSLVLLRFDHVGAGKVGYAFLPIALSNFAGPLLFGQPMDNLGRKPVIALSYLLAGFFLVGDGLLLLNPEFGAPLHIFGWAAVFVFASTAASAAYLTVSELFPQNVRALAVAIFYAFGTLLGGVSGPLIFGRLVGSGSRFALFKGYLLAAAFMASAGIIQAIWGTAAERRSLESLQES